MAVSVITFGELRAGVLRAKTESEQSLRVARFDAILSAFEPLPVDQHVAAHYGEVLAWARDHSRSGKATDLLIIATAAATDRRLYTRDQAQASLAAAVNIPVELIGGRGA